MNYKYIYVLILTYAGLIHASLSLDLIVFSFDRPMQLYALLESTQARLKGYSHITVLYRASDDTFEKAYQTVRHDFSYVTFKRHYGKHDFQETTSTIIQQSQSTHLFFAVDDIIITDECNLIECLENLEKTRAYCFALRLGKNITSCYTATIPFTPLPTFFPIDKDILSFQFGESIGEWDYPHSLDMNIYRKATVTEFINAGYEWVHPNYMEGRWSTIAPKHAVGLCFPTSKIMNIPMNVVNTDWGESRNMRNYSIHKLLEMFNQGKKIDINCVYKYLPVAPHAEFNLTFVAR